MLIILLVKFLDMLEWCSINFWWRAFLRPEKQLVVVKVPNLPYFSNGKIPKIFGYKLNFVFSQDILKKIRQDKFFYLPNLICFVKLL